MDELKLRQGFIVRVPTIPQPWVCTLVLEKQGRAAGLKATGGSFGSRAHTRD